MSDAQLPLDTGEGENGPSQRSDAPFDDAGVILVASPDAWVHAPPQKPGTTEAEIDGEASAYAHANVAAPAPDALTGEKAVGEFQPMLDLGLPDTPHGCLEQGGVPTLTSELMTAQLNVSPPHDDQPSVVVEPDDPGRADASEAATVQLWPHDDTRGAGLAADILTEISPIFSALDAAETAAGTAEHDESTLYPDAFDTGVPLPRTPLIDRLEATVAQTGSMLSPESSATDPPATDTTAAIDAAIENAASPELTPPEDATDTPSEQDQTSHGLLQDEAAARIAAEASATAAALENLKRLLAHKLSEPGIQTVPYYQDINPDNTSPPPIPVYRPPVQVPVVPPPMVAAPIAETAPSFEAYDDAPPRRRWVSFGSFFAGFALSWVLGAVLYVFLTGG
jgi:hypothetical protein